MSRTWISVLTLILYTFALSSTSFLESAGFFEQFSQFRGQQIAVYIQVALFIIAAIIIIFMHLKIKNPTQLELGKKEPKRYIIPIAIVGFFAVFVYQIAAVTIITNLFGINAPSPNTQNLLAISKSVPVMIILISIVGPILEEFVFRKVIFGEIYNKLRGSVAIRFIIASLVSSSLFAVLHNDPTHSILYFGMGMIFSAFYVYSKRIAVPILIHIFQNSFVVIIQLTQGEKIKEIQEMTSGLLHFWM